MSAKKCFFLSQYKKFSIMFTFCLLFFFLQNTNWVIKKGVFNKFKHFTSFYFQVFFLIYILQLTFRKNDHVFSPSNLGGCFYILFFLDKLKYNFFAFLFFLQPIAMQCTYRMFFYSEAMITFFSLCFDLIKLIRIFSSAAATAEKWRKSWMNFYQILILPVFI